MSEHGFPEEEVTQEIVKREPQTFVAPPHELAAEDITKAGIRLDMLAKLKRLALGYTSPDEWKMFGSNPYLEASGAMKFAEVYSVSFTDKCVEQFAYSDDRGPVIDYNATVVAHWARRTCPGEGVASTKDEFWNGKEDDPNNPGKQRAQRLPLSEIDTASVRKKAVTQALADATKKVLGLHFTKEEVEASFAAKGKNAGQMGSVAFGGKSADKNATTGKGTMTAKKQQIQDMLNEMTGGDAEVIAGMIERITENPAKGWKGKRSVADLTDRGADYVYGKVKSEFDKYVNEQAGQGGEQ